MNKSNSEAKVAHRKVQSSTTLNRKYVKDPSATPTAEQIALDYHAERQQRRQAIADQMNREAAKLRLTKKQQQKATTMNKINIETPTQAPTPSELKEQAVAKALKIAENVEEPKKPKFGIGRVILALSCAAISVFAIVYFVNLNMPNFSLRVAAMQTGIEATYPSYIPNGFSLQSIASEDKKVTVVFGDAKDHKFVLTEEKSSWDSTALLNNYVKNNYKEYSTVREQGLTIYINKEKATWVSGGIIYEIIVDGGALSQKQIKSIATSL